MLHYANRSRISRICLANCAFMTGRWTTICPRGCYMLLCATCTPLVLPSPSCPDLLLCAAYTGITILMLRELSRQPQFLSTTLWPKCNLVLAILCNNRYAKLCSWELCNYATIGFNSVRTRYELPPTLCILPAGRATGRWPPRPAGPWVVVVH